MAGDARTYIRLHDGMPDHPKVEALSDKAFRLLVETWCWSSRHLTDGRVPKATWERRATTKVRRELVDAGLVEVQGADGVQMHDYLEHQRSKADVAEIVAARKAASVKANHTRWHTGPKGKPDAECPLCTGPDADPKGTPKTEVNGSGGGSQSGSGSIPIDRGIGRGRDTVTPEETLGGGVPDSTAGDSDAPPPEPLRDPNNPRCAEHRDIPATDRGPNCRACAAVRREVESMPAIDSAVEARAAWRAAVDACDECDGNGKLELQDGSLVRHHDLAAVAS